MPNPLFEALTGGKTPGGTMPPQNMADAMQRLKADPMGMIRNAGYNVPDELAADPRAAVMHLIQTGQVGGPMMQRIRPFLSNLMGQ